MNLNRSLPHLTIAQLEYLVAVDEHDTWAKAGDAVGVSASALSQGLAELQRRIGVTLFTRDGRRQVARPEAVPVLRYARRVLAETRDLAGWAEELKSGTTGRVAVGMIDAAAIHWFGDTLAAYRSDHPDVDLHLTVAPSTQLLERLRSGGLDLAVCVFRDTMGSEDAANTGADDRGKARHAGVDRDTTEENRARADAIAHVGLVSEPLFVYAPPGQERRKPAQWGPWVSFPPDSHSRQSIARALRTAGADFEVVAESSQPDVLREMVYLGVGWAVLPSAEAEQGPHGLAPARKAPIATRQLVLAHRPNSHANPAAQELRARLEAAVN